jgi:hypothetical protein
MIYFLFIIIVFILMIISNDKCPNCGSRNSSIICPGVEESRVCNDCGMNHYSIDL